MARAFQNGTSPPDVRSKSGADFLVFFKIIKMGSARFRFLLLVFCALLLSVCCFGGRSRSGCVRFCRWVRFLALRRLPPLVCWEAAGRVGEKAPQAKNWFFRVFLEAPRNCRWCFWTPLDEISLCVNFQHLKKPGQKDLCEARRLTQAQTTPRKLALCEASCLAQVFFQRFFATFKNDKGRPKEP